MIFSDIIALAKAGYTPADVREFLAAESVKEEAPQMEQAAALAEKADTVEKPVENVEKLQQDNVQHTEPAADHGKVIDYKAKYEEAQAALQLAQTANTKQQQPKQESAEEVLEKLYQAFC